MSLNDELTAQGYTDIRVLPNGETAAVLRFMFTFGLMVGVDKIGYRTRFCFGTYEEARDSLAAWDGKGFPPGFWIKQKPENISREDI
jgi:hypothetical protein